MIAVSTDDDDDEDDFVLSKLLTNSGAPPTSKRVCVICRGGLEEDSGIIARKSLCDCGGGEIFPRS